MTPLASSALTRYDQMLKGMHNGETLLASLRNHRRLLSYPAWRVLWVRLMKYCLMKVISRKRVREASAAITGTKR